MPNTRRNNRRQIIQRKIDAKPALESIQERSDFMKSSGTWIIGSKVGKIMMGLVLLTMIGSIDVMPALGDDHKHDNRRNVHRDRGHDRGRPYYQPSYGYVTPPVVYAPAPQPGISIFLPIR